MDYILILRGFLMAWFILNFTPLESLRFKLAERLSRLKYVSQLLTCLKCMSFHLTWIMGLILSNEFMLFEAIGAALVAYVFELIIQGNKIRLND